MSPSGRPMLSAARSRPTTLRSRRVGIAPRVTKNGSHPVQHHSYGGNASNVNANGACQCPLL
jgi:hypothetical protein